jgi:hypothetical protein
MHRDTEGEPRSARWQNQKGKVAQKPDGSLPGKAAT